MPVIRVKPETYERMKSWAVPLEDTPNDAIERILEVAEEHRNCMARTENPEPEAQNRKQERPRRKTTKRPDCP